MSELIKHECGVTLVRLLKPLSYYQKKYGTPLYGLNKMQLLLRKMRNRGQDGAGLVSVKLNVKPGQQYIDRERNVSPQYIEGLFHSVHKNFKKLKPHHFADTEWIKANRPFTGEVLLGHLRYGTHGDNSIRTCHPFLRHNNWISRNLALAGNFNMTNVDEIFEELVGLGQYPKEMSDTVTIMEKIGHFLDDEVKRLHDWFKPDDLSVKKMNEKIFTHLDIQRILKRATKRFDGGYVMAGIIGHGDAFVLRDPNGIRPAFYFHDEEVVVMASERPAIQTAFDVHFNRIQELQRGHALIIKKDGRVSEQIVKKQRKRTACSFERIYFSRGTDRDIYLERKKLGQLLAKPVLKSIGKKLENNVFSYIPNTAQTAFTGLIDGVNDHLNQVKLDKVLALGKNPDAKKLKGILDMRPRVEALVVKDMKMRTFIADDASRKELVAHAYDVTYGIVKNEKDTLIVLDDSIVRGTTLRDSILNILSRLRPKKIIVVSSAPQIRYPDCYGIDMSKLQEFVAFNALIELLKETGQEDLIKKAYKRCKASELLPKNEVVNEIISLYDRFSYDAISRKIAEIVTPPGIKPKIEVIYQTVEGLHEACPDNNGDWYFSGKYPTPGGNRVANRAFINFYEGKTERAY